MVFLQIVEIKDIFVITFVFNRANIRTPIGMSPSKKIVFSLKKSEQNFIMKVGMHFDGNADTPTPGIYLNVLCVREFMRVLTSHLRI